MLFEEAEHFNNDDSRTVIVKLATLHETIDWIRIFEKLVIRLLKLRVPQKQSLQIEISRKEF